MSKSISDFDKAWISKHQMNRNETKRTFHLIEGCPYVQPETDTIIEVKPEIKTETGTYQLSETDLCNFCSRLVEMTDNDTEQETRR